MVPQKNKKIISLCFWPYLINHSSLKKCTTSHFHPWYIWFWPFELLFSSRSCIFGNICKLFFITLTDQFLNATKNLWHVFHKSYFWRVKFYVICILPAVMWLTVWGFDYVYFICIRSSTKVYFFEGCKIWNSVLIFNVFVIFSAKGLSSGCEECTHCLKLMGAKTPIAPVLQIPLFMMF